MIDIAQLLAAAEAQGTVFTLKDGRLFISSDEEPTAERLALLRPYRPAILAHLTAASLVENYIFMDIETASQVDLTRAGADAYAEHFSTLVLLLGYAIGLGPVRVWRQGQPMPDDLRRAIEAGMIPVAHNVNFDATIWRIHMHGKRGWPALPWDRWSDTAARARHARYPGSLDGSANALKIGQRKDKVGKALMLKLSRTAYRGGIPAKAAKLDQCGPYVIQDVEVLRAIHPRIPELSGEEAAVAVMSHAMNSRGMPVNLDAVRKLIVERDREDKRLAAEVARLTKGVITSPNQTKKLLAFLTTHGVTLPNIQAETLEDWLEENAGREDIAAQVIRLRQEAAHSAGKKLDSILAAAEGSGLVRGTFLLHGAHTGRWSGRGAQLQNLPRSTLVDTEATLARLLAGEAEPADSPDAGRSVKDRIAGVLRGLFQAPNGAAFVAVDLSQIESRVLCWLAGQEDKLALYRAGQDVYLPTARRLGSDSRDLGKLLVLSAGYGASARVMIAKAPTYNVSITEGDAARHITTWRADNVAIVNLWHSLHGAFRRAVESPLGAAPVTVNGKLTVWRDHEATRIKLPSGRDLIYRNARLEEDDRGYGLSLTADMPKGQVMLETRLWYGTLIENAVQAIARDVLVEAMLMLHRENVPLVGTIHDEIVALVPDAEGGRTKDRMVQVMTTSPAWADELPLAAEGFVNTRFIRPHAARKHGGAGIL